MAGATRAGSWSAGRLGRGPQTSGRSSPPASQVGVAYGNRYGGDVQRAGGCAELLVGSGRQSRRGDPADLVGDGLRTPRRTPSLRALRAPGAAGASRTP